MRKLILGLAAALSFSAAAIAQTPANIELQGLKSTPWPQFVTVEFEKLSGSDICYQLFVAKDGQTTQAGSWTLEGKPGEWLLAFSWFNPTGNAFTDGRQTSQGPAINVLYWTLSNALPADGKTRQACVAVYSKEGVPFGAPPRLIGYSQNFPLTTTNLLGTVTTTTTTTETETTSGGATIVTTTQTTQKVTRRKK